MKNLDCVPTLELSSHDLIHQAQCKGWIMSSIGTIVYVCLRIFGHKPQEFCGFKYFEVGYKWGGISLGWFFICQKGASITLKSHELGHCIQNAAVGGLWMLYYSLGSAIRCGVRRIINPKTPYDAWWFEGMATALGNTYYIQSET